MFQNGFSDRDKYILITSCKINNDFKNDEERLPLSIFLGYYNYKLYISYINKQMNKELKNKGRKIREEKVIGGITKENKIRKKCNMMNGKQWFIKMVLIVLLVRLSESCTQVNCSVCDANSTCTTCNSGYYLDSQNYCVKNTSNCRVSNHTTQVCTSCTGGYYLDKNNICTTINNCDVSDMTTQKCTTCANGYYLDSQNYCTPSLNCKLSNHTNQTCISCSDGFHLGGNNICTINNCDVFNQTIQECTTCSSGYYLDSQNYCVKNTSNCSVSNHITQVCISCTSGYYLDSQNYCVKNTSNCRVSNHTTQVCTSCTGGYYLDKNNICTTINNCDVSDMTTQKCTTCANGYYLDSDKYCVKSSNCAISDHISQLCTSCINQYYLDKQKICTIIKNCDVSNIVTQKCTKCSSGYYLDSQNYCAKGPQCIVSDHTSQLCTKCKSGYSLNSASICLADTAKKPINLSQTPNSTSIILPVASDKTLTKTDFDTLKLSTISTGKRLLQDQTTLTILSISIISNTQVFIIFANPQVSIAADSYIYIQLNNPSITLQSTMYKIPFEIKSQDSLNELIPNYPILVISAVLISIFIISIIIFAMYHSKDFNLHHINFSNYYKTINFIQKISLLRFNIPTVSSQLLLFGYYLKASYFNFGGIPSTDPYAYIVGNIPISSNYNQTYFQPTIGGFALLDIDANLIRNVGVAIIISIIMLLLKVIGFILFKKYPQYQWKTSYYSFVQFFEKIVRFPIIYFCIATLYFQQMFPVESFPDPYRYNSFRVGAIIYLVYFITLAVIEAIFTQTETSLRVVRLIQFICDMMNAVILILTMGTNQTLLLILTIVLQLVLLILLSRQKNSKYACFTKIFQVSSKVTKLYIIKIVGTFFEIVLLIVIMTSTVNIDGKGNQIVAIIFFLVVVILNYWSSIIALKENSSQVSIQIDPSSIVKQKSMIPIQIISSMNMVSNDSRQV